MRVLCVQQKPEFGLKEKNMDMISTLLEQQATDVDVIVLPKFFTTGFPNDGKELLDWAEPVSGPTGDRLSEWADTYNAYIVGGTLMEKDGTNFYETCPVFGRDGGLLGTYRRMHIGTHHQKLGMSDGVPDDMPVFTTDKGKIGIFTAYDALFPEVPRVLALKGAEVLFWLGSVDYQKVNVYDAMLKSAAFANEVYVVASNEAGSDNIDKYTFYGESRIINPAGEIVRSAGSSSFKSEDYQDRMLIENLNLDVLRKKRNEPKSLWKQRRPEVYSLIAEQQQP